MFLGSLPRALRCARGCGLWLRGIRAPNSPPLSCPLLSQVPFIMVCLVFSVSGGRSPVLDPDRLSKNVSILAYW